MAKKKRKVLKKKKTVSKKIKHNQITSKQLKLIGAIIETILAIPLLGGLIVISTVWMILAVEIALGIIGIIISNKEKNKNAGHIMQIVTGGIAWIPVVGWAMHIATAIVLWNEWKKE